MNFAWILLINCIQIIASQCPDWGRMETFKREGLEGGRYLGRWFQQEAHTSLADFSGKCWSKYYSRKYSGDPYELLSTVDYVSALTGFSHSRVDDIKISDFMDPNLFTVKKPIVSDPTYRVIATDYVTFAIEYSCQDSSLFLRHEKVVVLTRRKRPLKRILRKAHRALRELGLNTRNLKETPQDCDNKLTAPPSLEDFDESGNKVRRNFEVQDQDSVSQEDDKESTTKWKSPVDLAKDFFGSVAYLGQSVFAPWTLPGQVFSVRGREEAEKQSDLVEADYDYYYEDDDLEPPKRNKRKRLPNRQN